MNFNSVGNMFLTSATNLSTWDMVMIVFTLLTGVCVFLFGMKVMGDGLERRAGNALKSVLGRLTSNKFLGFLTGFLVTCVIQSSSATTVMVVGFVNIGAMGLTQALFVILGSAVGTTITAWITSIPTVEILTVIMALGGTICIMFLKGDKNKDIGFILLGFAVLMTGLEVMSGAVSDLKQPGGFVEKMFQSFQNPFLSFGVGTIFTAILQSSSASSVILQDLSAQGLITFKQAIPIIFGLNIGTTITALIACVGANKNAKRAAVAHLIMKSFGAVIGVVIFFIITITAKGKMVDFLNANPTKVQIAICHTSFNVINSVILFPLCGVIEKIVRLLIKDKDEEPQENVLLDEKLMIMPAVALERCKVLAIELGNLAAETLKKSLSLLEEYDADLAKQIKKDEDKTDMYEDILGKYLVKLSSTQIGEQESLEVTKLLRAINDFERMGDHALNVLEAAEELKEKDLAFSASAKEELKVITRALKTILDMTMQAFTNNDLALAEDIEPLEEVIDRLKEQMRARHVVRMQQQKCSIEVGFVWVDLLTSLERVSDHCSNIGIGIIDNYRSRVNSHEFL
ncbi:MAG: Na/Pi cotransporter family protein [Clostridia bacterium]|nr:Na/Pi cotransporter family protein [Clostridia bacterium]